MELLLEDDEDAEAMGKSEDDEEGMGLVVTLPPPPARAPMSVPAPEAALPRVTASRAGVRVFDEEDEEVEEAGLGVKPD